MLTLFKCAISNHSITGLLRRKIIYSFTFYIFQNGVMDRLRSTYCQRFLIIFQM